MLSKAVQVKRALEILKTKQKAGELPEAKGPIPKRLQKKLQGLKTYGLLQPNKYIRLPLEPNDYQTEESTIIPPNHIGKFTCPSCDGIFMHLNALNSHVASSHQNTLFCYCSKTFKTQAMLNKHLKSHLMEEKCIERQHLEHCLTEELKSELTETCLTEEFPTITPPSKPDLSEKIESEPSETLPMEELESESLETCPTEELLTIPPPSKTHLSEKIESEPSERHVMEELQSEPSEPHAMEELESEPSEPHVIEELGSEPSKPCVMEKLESEPLEPHVIEELEYEPLEPHVMEELESEPSESHVMEELESELSQPHIMEELESELSQPHIMEEFESEPSESRVMEELESEPSERRLMEELESEPSEPCLMEELESEPSEPRTIEEIGSEVSELCQMELEIVECEPPISQLVKHETSVSTPSLRVKKLRDIRPSSFDREEIGHAQAQSVKKTVDSRPISFITEGIGYDRYRCLRGEGDIRLSVFCSTGIDHRQDKTVKGDTIEGNNIDSAESDNKDSETAITCESHVAFINPSNSRHLVDSNISTVPKIPIWRCKMCGLVFPAENRWLTHCDGIQFCCHFCKLVLGSAHELKQHESQHLKVIPLHHMQ